MFLIKSIVDLFLHLDKNLSIIIQQFGPVTYILLFVVIFMETGFVVTPFLPGDSLLFAAGTLATSTTLQIGWLFAILAGAAILGDTVNYWIGHFIGPKVFKEKSRLFKKEHLIKTQKFYDKHGGKTIILARFIPIIRTFAPFVAGVGKMHYAKFIAFNFVGGILWVSLFLFGGYFFGNLPFIKKNFHYAILVIVLVSILPGVFEYIKHHRKSPVKIDALKR